MIWLRACALLVLSSILIVSDAGGYPAPASQESKQFCGPLCLLAVCQKLGIEATLPELTALSGYDQQAGTSMQGLLKAVESKGLRGAPVKISADELWTRTYPSIALLWGNHFVVVERADADTLRITDPPQEPVRVKKEEFGKRYSGFALLIGKEANDFPASRAEGPDLRLDSYMWSFGSAYEGDQIEHAFKCRNVGNADLVISKVEASCGNCLVPVVGAQTIAPGGEGQIKVLLVTANQRRRVGKTLYVTCNDPISPVVHVDVVGYVKPARLCLSTGIVHFGNPRRREGATEEVYIPSEPEDGLEVISATSDSPYVTAILSRSTNGRAHGYLLTATLKPRAPLGEFTSRITIVSNHPKQPKAELPVRAVIRGNIDLNRESFFLGLVRKGQTRSAAVTVSTVGRDRLEIAKIDNPLSYLAVDVSPKTEGKEYVLTATLKADAPVGNIKGDVVIHTNDADQPEIKIPVYAYVEE